MPSSELPAGVTVMAIKGVLPPGSTRVLIFVCNNSTRNVNLPKCTVIAQCQAANVVPAPTVQMESADDQTVADNGNWLLDKLDLSGIDLWMEHQQQQAQDILWQNIDLFSKHPLDLGRTDLCEHEIKLTDD